jgi:hypothetical protein
MAVLFIDSAQHYTDPVLKWDSAIGGTVMNTSIFRTGTQSIQFNASAGYYVQKNFANNAHWFLGFAFRPVFSSPGAPATVLQLYDAGTVQLTLTFDNLGRFQFYRSSSPVAVGSLSSAFTQNVWHYIEVEVVINSSTGVASLHVDGVSVLTGTGLNTQATANAYANQIMFGPKSLNTFPANTYAQDFYILDASGSAPWNTFLGDSSVLAFLPSGNGSTQQFTPTYAAWPASTVVTIGTTIQDSNGNIQRVTGLAAANITGSSPPTWATTGGAVTGPDGNQVYWTCLGSGSNPGSSNWFPVNDPFADYNYSYIADNTVGHEQLYTFPALPGTTSSVYAVAVNNFADKDDAATRAIRSVVKSAGTTVDNGSDHGLTLNSYQNFQDVYELDPNTSAQWTATGVNAAQFGVKTTI